MPGLLLLSLLLGEFGLECTEVAASDDLERLKVLDLLFVSLFLQSRHLNDVIVSMLDAQEHLKIALSVLPRRLFGLYHIGVKLLRQSAVSALNLIHGTARRAPE